MVIVLDWRVHGVNAFLKNPSWAWLSCEEFCAGNIWFQTSAVFTRQLPEQCGVHRDCEHELVFSPKNLHRKHRLAPILDTTPAEVQVQDGAGYETNSEFPTGGSCPMHLARA